MFNDAKSISFRGKEVKQIIRTRDNAIIYQLEDSISLILEIREDVSQSYITIRTEDENGDFVPFTIESNSNSGIYVNNNLTIPIPAGHYYQSLQLTINSFNVGDVVYVNIVEEDLISNTVTIQGIPCIEILLYGDNCSLQPLISSTNNTSCIIYWGDGESEQYGGWGGNTHQYDETGYYTIKFSNPRTIVTGFSGTNIIKMSLPESVVSISNNLFYGGTNALFKEISFPASLETISVSDYSGLIADCPNLEKIYLNWTTSSTIIPYQSNWFYGEIGDFVFIVPDNTRSLYVAKGYPSNKLLENTINNVSDLTNYYYVPDSTNPFPKNCPHSITYDDVTGYTRIRLNEGNRNNTSSRYYMAIPFTVPSNNIELSVDFFTTQMGNDDFGIRICDKEILDNGNGYHSYGAWIITGQGRLAYGYGGTESSNTKYGDYLGTVSNNVVYNFTMKLTSSTVYYCLKKLNNNTVISCNTYNRTDSYNFSGDYYLYIGGGKFSTGESDKSIYIKNLTAKELVE